MYLEEGIDIRELAGGLPAKGWNSRQCGSVFFEVELRDIGEP